MRAIGLLVLALVFYGGDPAADLFGSTPARWAYTFQGWGGMILSICVALACRDWTARFIFAWIAFEWFLIGLAGSINLYSVAKWAVNPYVGLLGIPALYKLGLFVTAAIALWISLRWKEQK